MAGSIASLFGPSAEEIVYERQKEERERQDLNFYRGLQAIDVPGVATGMVAGRGIGQGLTQAAQGLFGTSQQLEDPRLAKALAMRQVFEGVTAADLRDPDKLEAMAQKAIDYGNVEAAFQLDTMAVDARAALTPDLKSVGTKFKLATGEVVTGGYMPDGRPVAIMPGGQRVEITGGYTVLDGQVGSVSTDDMAQAGSILDTLDIDVDDGEQTILANRAKEIQYLNPGMGFGTAFTMAVQESNNPTDNGRGELSYKDLGLSRSANKDNGEQVRINSNGTVSIIAADGTVVETGNIQLKQDQIDKFRTDLKKPKRDLEDREFLSSLGIPRYSKIAGDRIVVDPNTRYVYVIDKQGRRKGTSNRALTKEEAGVIETTENNTAGKMDAFGNTKADPGFDRATGYDYKDSPLYSEGFFTPTAEAVEQYKRRRAR